MKRLLFLLVLATVDQAFAQKQELGLTLGVIKTTDRDLKNPAGSIQSDGGVAMQANYGYRILDGKKASLYVETHFLANGLRNLHSSYPASPHDYATLFVTPGIRVKFHTGSKLEPYLAAGGGYAAYEKSKLNFNGTPNTNRFLNTGAFDFGGGVDAPLWRWIGWRVEVRDFYTGNPDFNGSLKAGGQHNIVAGGGLVLRIGRK